MKKYCIPFIFCIFASAVVLAEWPPLFTNQDLEKYKRPGDNKTTSNFKRITLDFVDADIQAVFRLIKDIAVSDGIEVTVDPTIRGKTTIKVINEQWINVVEMLAIKHNLDYKISGRSLLLHRRRY